MEKSGREYFPGLDGLRCAGVLVILFAHIEILKGRYGFPGSFYLFKYPDIGNVAVTLFFVLSGFLITALLLREKLSTGSVAVLGFYRRRVLRIWPVYYLMIFVTFLALNHLEFFREPDSDYKTGSQWVIFGLYSVHLSNLHFLFPAITIVAHLWTIGVEEQFYFIWPHLVKYSTKFIRTVIILTAGLSILKLIVFYIPFPEYVSGHVKMLQRFLFVTRLECIALGGVAAWIYIHGNDKIKKLLFTKAAQLLCFALILLLLATGRTNPAYGQLLYSILFGVFVLNVAANPDSVIKLRSKWMQFVGKRSYGIYVYHPVIVIFVIKLTGMIPGINSNPAYSNLIIYPIAILLTFAVAAVSYRYMEAPLINSGKKHE